MRRVHPRLPWRNQFGAYGKYFGVCSYGFSPGAGLPGELVPSVLGADIGDVSERNADLASRRMRSVLFSTTPKSRKGIAVAATSSFARRGVLASGSHRKSWAERKNVRQAQTASGTGEKDERQPEELVQHLGFLHGIGHTGHDQTERAKREEADGDEQEKRNGITKTRDVKNDTCKEQFDYHGRNGKHVISDDARGEQVAGGHRRHMKAPQDSLFPERDESRAEAPETAHHIKREDWAEIKP